MLRGSVSSFFSHRHEEVSLSHAISQVKPSRTHHQALVIAIIVAFFVGVCALIARSQPSARPSTLEANPAVNPESGDQSAPAQPARRARVYRDPDMPGRRF